MNRNSRTLLGIALLGFSLLTIFAVLTDSAFVPVAIGIEVAVMAGLLIVLRSRS